MRPLRCVGRIMHGMEQEHASLGWQSADGAENSLAAVLVAVSVFESVELLLPRDARLLGASVCWGVCLSIRGKQLYVSTIAGAF